MTHPCERRRDMHEWVSRLSLSPAPRQTMEWLIELADHDCRIDVTLGTLAQAMDGIKEQSAYSRLRELVRRGLLILTSISTEHVKRRFLVEIRYPHSEAETQRILERMAFQEHGRRLVEQAPQRRLRREQLEDLIRRGAVRIDDIWT